MYVLNEFQEVSLQPSHLRSTCSVLQVFIYVQQQLQYLKNYINKYGVNRQATDLNLNFQTAYAISTTEQ